MQTNTTVLGLSALSSILTPIASAGNPALFTDRAQFEAQAGTLQIEGFEAEPLADLVMPAAFASGLGVRLASGQVTGFIDAGDPFDNAFINTTDGGRKYLAFGRDGVNADGSPLYETGSYSVEFALTESSNSFGFDLSGVILQHTAMGFSVTTLDNGQVRDDFFFASDQIFGVRFYGFTTGLSFDTVRIHISADAGIADYAAFDEVSWRAVPSPAGITLLAFGGLAATRRRR